MHCFTLLFLLLTPIIPAIAQQQSTRLTRAVDELAQRVVAEKQVPGLSVLLVKDGKIEYQQAFGYADPVDSIPMRTDHIFRIASQTKAVTSLAAMMLWEEGRFLLEDPVSKYIPAFRNPQVLDTFDPVDSSFTTIPALREITIRDLLRHTAGIPYPVLSGMASFDALFAKAGVKTGVGATGLLKDQIALLAAQPLAHHPGEQFTYGLSTDVLGYLIEIWSGQPLDVFIQQRILEPLHMRNTYFRIPEQKADRLVPLLVKNEGVFRHVKDAVYDGHIPDYPLHEDIYPSGGAGLSATPVDYARFLQLLLDEGIYKGKRLVGEKTIKMMLANQLVEPVLKQLPDGFRFGLGFGLVTEDNRYLHAAGKGSFFWAGAFNTHYWVDPKEDLILLVFAQEYLPLSFSALGSLFRNVVYAHIDALDKED